MKGGGSRAKSKGTYIVDHQGVVRHACQLTGALVAIFEAVELGRLPLAVLLLLVDEHGLFFGRELRALLRQAKVGVLALARVLLPHQVVHRRVLFPLVLGPLDRGLLDDVGWQLRRGLLREGLVKRRQVVLLLGEFLGVNGQRAHLHRH